MSRPSTSTSTPTLTRATSGVQSRNPVAVRLYKVLGTSFDDPATKEALETLSLLYAPSSSKGKDVKRDSDDTDVGDNENHTGGTAARARKNLKRDMERKLVEGSKQFLKAFEEVDQKLDDLQRHIDVMRLSCNEAEQQLNLTSQSSKTLLENAGNLHEERQQVEAKKSIVHLFLNRFTLNESEIEALTSREVPVGRKFFAAMDKTERIRTDCRVLMAGEEGPTKAGLDIMSATSSYLEQGYDKILRWCLYEFRQLGRDMQVEVSPTMTEAVKRLRQRPELLSEAMASLASIRDATLLNAFITALTRGKPRPIELHAHDPLRYVGDMLAWVHQAIAAEREFLEGMFGVKHDGRMVGSVRKNKEGEKEELIHGLMDDAVKKLSVPLKARVQQTIKSQESSIVSYKIANLCQFYMMTMKRTIGQTAFLSSVLNELTDDAYNFFYGAIDARGKSLARTSLDPEDISVSPPIPLLDHAQILREVMSVYQASLTGDEDETEMTEGFEQTLDAMVDPAVKMLFTSSEEKKKIKPRWDDKVFVLNSLCYIITVLEPFSAFTSEMQHSIQEEINDRVEALAEEHYRDLIIDTGLAQVVNTLETWDGNEPLSHIPSAQPSELQRTLHHFALWLSSDDVVQSRRLLNFTQIKMQSDIHLSALTKVLRAYERICVEVRKKENRYEAGATLLGSERPFGQLELLGQIFGIDIGGAVDP